MSSHSRCSTAFFRRFHARLGTAVAALLTLLLATAAVPARALAGQVSYSTTKSISYTDYTNVVHLPQFDPSYGTLLGVTFVLDYTFRSDARIENLDSVPRSGVVHGANGTLTALDSGGAISAPV